MVILILSYLCSAFILISEFLILICLPNVDLNERSKFAGTTFNTGGTYNIERFEVPAQRRPELSATLGSGSLNLSCHDGFRTPLRTVTSSIGNQNLSSLMAVASQELSLQISPVAGTSGEKNHQIGPLASTSRDLHLPIMPVDDNSGKENQQASPVAGTSSDFYQQIAPVAGTSGEENQQVGPVGGTSLEMCKPISPVAVTSGEENYLVGPVVGTSPEIWNTNTGGGFFSIREHAVREKKGPVLPVFARGTKLVKLAQQRSASKSSEQQTANSDDDDCMEVQNFKSIIFFYNFELECLKLSFKKKNLFCIIFFSIIDNTIISI
jgi:hypothetical protein